MLGNADPYVKLTLGKQKAISATVKNNHNPEWNFESRFDVDQNTTENICIMVFDEDLGKDDSLGNASLILSLIQKQKRLLNQWIPLENCKSGEILLSAEFIPSSLTEHQKEPKQGIVTDKIKEAVQEIDVEESKIQEETSQTKIGAPVVGTIKLAISKSERIIDNQTTQLLMKISSVPV